MTKNTTIKIPELKRLLKDYNDNELIHLITELYKQNHHVQNYLSVKFLGEEKVQDLYHESKTEIEDEFFPAKGFAKMRLAKAKRAIANFKKLTGDHIKTVDLKLYYVEIGTEFTNEYGDIDEKFYNSMISMYANVINECDKDEKLFQAFRNRLYNIVLESNGIGWGYHDDLGELYYSLKWLSE